MSVRLETIKNMSSMINTVFHQMSRQLRLEPDIVIFGALCLLYLTNKEALNNTWVKVIAVGLVFHLGSTALSSSDYDISTVPSDSNDSSSAYIANEGTNESNDSNDSNNHTEYYGDSENFLSAPDEDISDKFFQTTSQIGHAYQNLAPPSARDFWGSIVGTSVNKPSSIPLPTRSLSNWNPYQQHD